MDGTRDDLRDLIDLGVGRALLGACGLALLITTWLPVTRREGSLEWILKESSKSFNIHDRSTYSLSLWDLAGEGEGSAIATILPLVVLAVMCWVAVFAERMIRWVAPYGVILLVWLTIFAFDGYSAADTSTRWLYVLIPVITIGVGIWSDRARRRVRG